VSDRSRKQRGLHPISLVLAIAFIGISLTQPSFAKTQYAQRARHAGKGQVSAKGHGATYAPIPKGTSSGDMQTKDSGDEVITPAHSRAGLPGDRRHGPNVNAKSGAPGTFQARRAAVPGPSEAIPRNSIGVALPPKTATTSKPILKPEAPVAVAPQGAIANRIVIAKPVTTTSVPSRGKIDGAGLIRPSVAPSALGGPAKTFAGINGTTLRPKR